MTGNLVVAGILGALLGGVVAVIKTNFDVRDELRGQQAQMTEYVRVLNLVNERQGEVADALKKAAEGRVPFEATGYTAKVLDDGRIEVSFLRRLGPEDPDHPKEDGYLGEFRTVILPAWMWAQVTAEGALKLGFDALEKAKENRR